MSQKARQRVSPGLIALILVAVLAFSLSFSINYEKSILDKAYGQVVVVVCGDSYGTGWFVNHDTVVTAYHVVQGCASPVLVRGPWHSNASIIAMDPENDVAALRVENTPSWAKGLPLADKIAIGDEAFVVGYPVQLYEEVGHDVEKMSEIPRVNRVTITWINPERRIMEFNPGTDAGNSGGPVVSIEYQGVTGIVIYARHGVVAEGFYALRGDALVEFFQKNNIEYHVAGRHSFLFYAGLGIVVLLILFVLREKGVNGMRRIFPVLLVLLVSFPMHVHAAGGSEWFQWWYFTQDASQTTTTPQEPPPVFYGWVYYDDGTPAPQGIEIKAITGCGSFTTYTGYGTVDPNAYILKIDVPYQNEDCDGRIVVMNETVWQGHLSTFMLVKLNITINKTSLSASSNTSPGDLDEIVRLSGSLDQPYAPGNTNSGKESKLDAKLLGLGLLAGFLFTILARGGRRW